MPLTISNLQVRGYEHVWFSAYVYGSGHSVTVGSPGHRGRKRRRLSSTENPLPAGGSACRLSGAVAVWWRKPRCHYRAAFINGASASGTPTYPSIPQPSSRSWLHQPCTKGVRRKAAGVWYRDVAGPNERLARTCRYGRARWVTTTSRRAISSHRCSAARDQPPLAGVFRRSISHNGELDANAGVTVSFNRGSTTGELDLLDMNGDGYPDSIGNNRLGFNNWGRPDVSPLLSANPSFSFVDVPAATGIGFPRSIHHENASFGLTRLDRVRPRQQPSASGWTKAILLTCPRSGSAGARRQRCSI